jgi:hypothetical protein
MWGEVCYSPDDNELFGFGCFAVDGLPRLAETVDRYLTARSSSDPDTVAALYSEEASFTDGLADLEATGAGHRRRGDLLGRRRVLKGSRLAPRRSELETPVMHQPIALIGIGEMGGVFAKALLRAEYPVYPIVRATALGAAAATVPEPELVLVSVGEADLDPVLGELPSSWKTRTGLIQNELLPRDWERHDIVDPTVAVVWFEKKPGQDVKQVIATPVAGPAAGLLAAALIGIGIEAYEIRRDELTDQLVMKNCYILTSNIAGLRTGGTTGELWNEHRELATVVVAEVLDIQEWLVGTELDRDRLVAEMANAFLADPEHKTTGRSAPLRLDRALRHAAEAEIDVPTLAAIAREQGVVA